MGTPTSLIPAYNQLTASPSGLGHLGIQFARAMGYHTVALSSSGSKEALARSLGAHDYIDASKEDPAQALQRLGGAAAVLCTAPNPRAIEALVPGLAVGGIIVLLAVSEPVTVPSSTSLLLDLHMVRAGC